MSNTFYIVDAFTSELFGGNPAAVILSENELDFDLRVKISKELAQPAAAFVSHSSLSSYASGSSAVLPKISWFASPSGRPLPFCGHATMAASVIIFNILFPTLCKISFGFSKTIALGDGKFGKEDAVLIVEKGEDGRIKISVEAALEPEGMGEKEWEETAKGLGEGFGFKEEDVVFLGKSFAKDLVLVDLLVVLSPTVDLASLTPNFPRLSQIPFHGLWLTTFDPLTTSTSETFRSRAFFPAYGINEDHVCGTAHTLIAPYWATKYPELKGTKMEANQVSKRGGKLGITWDGEWGTGVVTLSGTGVVVAEGKLFL